MLKGKFSSRRRVTEEVDAMSGLANLSDVMLVFACGLMAAVILNWNVDLSKTRVEILQREQMQELDNAEELEQDIQSSSSFEQKGTVYEDPETGKLYVVMPKSSMAASKNMIALEINGLHVHLTFTPFPADDTVAAVRAILKNSYVRTLQT